MSLIPDLLRQMPIGIAVGLAGGVAAVWLINHLRLEYDGLYPVLSIASVCLTFGGAHIIGGNEFLAVYVAGLVMGSRNFLHKIAIVQFHDGIAWLMQIVMFLVLGLLVFPSQLASVAWPGLLLAFFLIFVARPFAVFVALLLTRMSRRSRLFVAWAGLRGAVPIILATFPLIADIPKANTIFNLVFFIVITSVLVQGSTLRPVARLLGVVAPEPSKKIDAKPTGRAELMEVDLTPGSPAIGKQVVELGLPRTALLVLLRRGGESYIPRGATILAEGDTVTIATRKEDHDDLRALFQGSQS
jgi:potassium/hydrogen antiporter